MGPLAESVKYLVSQGVTGDALVTAIAALEETLYISKPKSNSAIRQQRYRRNKALQSVTHKNKSRLFNESEASPVTKDEKNSIIYNNTYLLKKDTIKKESKKGSRLQISSLPEEWKIFCSTERPDLNPEKVFDAFADWWRAAPGSKGLKADWLATWRNWVRNQKQVSGQMNFLPRCQEPKKSNVKTF